MSNILAEANKAQTHDEVIEALRAQVAALTQERDDYRRALRSYRERAFWLTKDNKSNPSAHNVLSDGNFNGWDCAREALDKYATTAPVDAGA